MGLEQFTDVEEALAYVRSQGYQYSFTCQEQGWFFAGDKKIYCPEVLQIDACHRFLVCSGAHQVTVLYAVKADDGTKGYILDNCSTYGNALFGDYLHRMKLKQLQPLSKRKAS